MATEQSSSQVMSLKVGGKYTHHFALMGKTLRRLG